MKLFNKQEERVMFSALQEYRYLIVDEIIDGKMTKKQTEDYRIATELRDRF